MLASGDRTLFFIGEIRRQKEKSSDCLSLFLRGVSRTLGQGLRQPEVMVEELGVHMSVLVGDSVVDERGINGAEEGREMQESDL